MQFITIIYPNISIKIVISQTYKYLIVFLAGAHRYMQSIISVAAAQCVSAAILGVRGVTSGCIMRMLTRLRRCVHGMELAGHGVVAGHGEGGASLG